MRLETETSVWGEDVARLKIEGRRRRG